MDGLFTFVQSWRALIKLRYDDDTIDRLNHLYSGLLLLFCGVLVSAKQYVGSPMLCWLPPYISGFEGYVNNYCWISNTWWMPLHHSVPTTHEDRADREIGYYQWVPFYLLIMALLFHFPCMLWRTCNSMTGISVHSIIEAAISADNMDDTARKANVKYLAIHIDNTLDRMREFRTGIKAKLKKVVTFIFPLCGSNRQGFTLFFLYLLVKVLYLLNTLLQIAALNLFLDLKAWDSGAALIQNIYSGHNWEVTGRFPRVTLCDFIIKVLGNQHRHTVQCLLPVNLFNEKIFLVLYFWLRILAVLNAINLLMWIGRMMCFRNSYIKKRLLLTDSYKPSDRRVFGSFVDHHLRTDGIFLIRLVKANSGDLLSIELVRKMWLVFKKRLSEGDADYDTDEDDEIIDA